MISIESISVLPTSFRRSVRKCAYVGLIALAGWGVPGPSVPLQQGANLSSARAVIQSCARFTPRGCTSAVTGSYVAGVVLNGLVVGPIIMVSNQGSVRASGEARAVDRCLADQGYLRRDLAVAEVRALNANNKYEWELLLNHLIGGGTFETFRK